MQIMDSWLIGGSERITFGLSDGVFPSFDSTSPTKEAPSEWGVGSSCYTDRSVLDTRQGIVENPTIIDPSFLVQEISCEGSVKEFAENGVKEHVANSCSSFLTKSSVGEKEEGSKDSSSIVDPDANDSSFIDLKLGRRSEPKSSEDSKSSKGLRSFSQQESPAPAKRSRSTGLIGQTPLCQVQGCNMDLSSFKDYYKRHRVCQIHSKTAKVIVNGIQQRFCQQCSRFHLLTEFDDGKRSCRKRLAGHNERRRKPQIVFQSGKSSMMLPYHGGNFLGTALPGKAPFFCQNGIAQPGSYESINWSKLAGLDNSFTSMQMPTSSAFDEHNKSFIPPRGTAKEISFVDGDVTLPGSMYNGYASRYSSGVSASNSVSDAGATDKGCAGVTNSSFARSLLSSQPENLCAYPLAMPVYQPSMFASDIALKTKPSSSEKAVVALHASTNSICSSGVDTPGYGRVGFVPCEIKSSGSLVAQAQKNFHDSPFGGSDVALPHEHDHTVNLLQLSSLLQDAESRKRSLQVKQEFEPFASLPIL